MENKEVLNYKEIFQNPKPGVKRSQYQILSHNGFTSKKA